jgi:tRNA pseudouridine38-40 synthase
VSELPPRQALKALVAYDGSNYWGFQMQRGQPTIQGAIEATLRRLTGEQIRIRYAGRTDRGVHAAGQVIAFESGWRHPVADLERGLNALLPQDIAVRQVEPVAEDGFHPRFSARSRLYRYTVWTAPWRWPLNARYTHHEPRDLDLALMNQAAGLLVGDHDFASFGRPTQGESTIRSVRRAVWQRQAEHLLTFDIEANAFLRHMVRTMVATLLEVGRGHRTPQEVLATLEARDRSLAAPLAPASGLCLISVTY